MFACSLISMCSKNVKKKRGGGKSHIHIISLSRANKTDHQHKPTHTHTDRCWRRITPFSEGRNTLRLGARGKEGAGRVGIYPERWDGAGAVPCSPLDGTRAFGCGLKGPESATLNRSRRATAFSRASLAQIFSVFNCSLVHFQEKEVLHLFKQKKKI